MSKSLIADALESKSWPFEEAKKILARIENSKKDLNFFPLTKIKNGIPKFIKWYKNYYDLK